MIGPRPSSTRCARAGSGCRKTDRPTTMTDRATIEPPAPASVSELSARMSEEAVRLDKELGEVELLISQARAEATRHETRRAAAAEKLTAAIAGGASGEAAPDTA